MEKLKAIFALFRHGEVVADPAKWKNRQVSATVITGIIWALLKLFGVADEVGGETVDAISVGLISAVNLVLTFSTSDKIGLPPRS